MHGWFSPSSLIGMVLALAFGVVASRSLKRGVACYAVLGALPVLQVGAFSGNEMVQGIPQAEVLATVLIALWLLQRDRAPLGNLLPFERWLLVMIPVSIASLVSGFAWLDSDVPQQNVKVAVSVGQILLFAWPMGVYFVTSRLVDSPSWVNRFSKTILWLAVPQVVMLVLPGSRSYLGWSTYFGLVAAPLALARATFEEAWWKRLALGLYLAPPLIEGLLSGKTFLYGYILVSVLVTFWVRARRIFWLSLPVIGFVGAMGLLMPEAIPLPGALQRLVEVEESQQSWGGETGRGQLMVDAVSIWSGYPLLGVGPANSYPYMLRYSGIGTPHSQYANLLLECGIVGLGVFVAFVLGAIRFGLQAVSVPRDVASQSFALGWFSSFVALAILSITGDYMLHSIRNGGIEMFIGFYLHWVFLGAAVGLVRHEAVVEADLRLPAPRTWNVRPHEGDLALPAPR
jgi:hypothetical protein